MEAAGLGTTHHPHDGGGVDGARSLIPGLYGGVGWGWGAGGGEGEGYTFPFTNFLNLSFSSIKNAGNG